MRSLTSLLPLRMQNQVDALLEQVSLLNELRDPRVLAALAPSGVRGLVLRQGKQGTPTKMPASHAAHFDWTYPADNPQMRALYTKAKTLQWNSDQVLPWKTSVDPFDPEHYLLPDSFFCLEDLRGVTLTPRERQKIGHDLTCWLLSQFLHGEQGALFAAAQVTEAVQWFDGKLYGATQVMDEARHVEVFHRYLDTKANKLYQINDNLFVIIDALMTDSRWDMKFLGMQIMVEGLALGAFGSIYKTTREPLLKELLRYVIHDEARHVHYGVLALKQHFAQLSERDRREREDWAFEVALLMRNRLVAYEVYEEHFEGLIPRSEWRRFAMEMPGMRAFRQVMFSRLVPNLRAIGLITPRIIARYEAVGLAGYMNGLSAERLDGEGLIAALDQAA